MESAHATRLRRARWRSPQLVLGVLLVLISTVAGVRIVAGADDTVPVWVAVRDLNAGMPLTDDLVEIRHVVIDGGPGVYHSGEVDESHVVQRDVRAGELIPRTAVAAADDGPGTQAVRLLTVALPSAEVPAALGVGDAVDVWLAPAVDGEAELAAPRLTVTDAGGTGTLGMSGSHTAVTVAVRADDDAGLDALVGRLIAGSRDGLIYLSRHP